MKKLLLLTLALCGIAAAQSTITPPSPVCVANADATTTCTYTMTAFGCVHITYCYGYAYSETYIVDWHENALYSGFQQGVWDSLNGFQYHHGFFCQSGNPNNTGGFTRTGTTTAGYRVGYWQGGCVSTDAYPLTDFYTGAPFQSVVITVQIYEYKERIGSGRGGGYPGLRWTVTAGTIAVTYPAGSSQAALEDGACSASLQ
jgi:hypothetical protein